MIWAIAIVAGIALGPFLREALRPRMDTLARRAAPGKFIELSQGVTHYQWLGADQGSVAVCVHGLTTPTFVWGPIARGLGALGYRVLVYDLYGRGFSDRPKGAQDAAFFNTQLEELLAALELGDDLTLLGYSMGAAIATGFAARHRERLRRMILIAPAGMGHDLGPVVRLVVNSGRFGDWLMLAFYGRSLRRSTEAERCLESAIEGVVDLQQNELKYRGFRPAVLSSIRGILSETQEAEHREISANSLPVLAIWGREDEVIPLAGKGKLAQWNPDAHHEVINDVGHCLAYTHPDEVLAVIGAWMQDRDLSQ
ncbi:Hydrolase, alpha/beta fold family [hydrothermal vent metagenome]|uniref:Hydrolase, alpha/beta fold family n=1 Tax=hydrothermal vent metagenome TaxID=652676 RepID=A0A3B0SCD7_9ZZZZ